MQSIKASSLHFMIKHLIESLQFIQCVYLEDISQASETYKGPRHINACFYLKI